MIYYLSFLKAIPNENYFVFRQIIINRRRKRSLDGSDIHLVNELKRDPLVDWVEQQEVKKRVKRNTMFYHPSKSTLSSIFNDPEWDKQWYMVSLIISLKIKVFRPLFKHDENEHGSAMNISGAWRLGFTGKNIVVTILDDGIEKDHPDLIQNYVSICDVSCMLKAISRSHKQVLISMGMTMIHNHVMIQPMKTSRKTNFFFLS
jgi:subtilisin family serine protease